MRLPVIVLLLSLAFAGSAVARDVICISTPEHVVAITPNENEIGSSLAVYGKDGPASCVYEPTSATLSLVGSYQYVGAVDEYLVITDGSSLDTLMVYDLTSNEQLLAAPTEEVYLSSVELLYWERGEEGTKENCPEYDTYMGYGGSAVITREVKYNFASRTPIATGASHCEYRQ